MPNAYESIMPARRTTSGVPHFGSTPGTRIGRPLGLRVRATKSNMQLQLRSDDPEQRKAAIASILQASLDGDRMSGWQSIQTKGCTDADATVRLEAVRALAKLLRESPNGYEQAVLEAEYLDRRVLDRLERRSQRRRPSNRRDPVAGRGRLVG